jgi:hypothetical protein
MPPEVSYKDAHQFGSMLTLHSRLEPLASTESSCLRHCRSHPRSSSVMVSSLSRMVKISSSGLEGMQCRSSSWTSLTCQVTRFYVVARCVATIISCASRHADKTPNAQTTLPILDNDFSQRINAIVQKTREMRRGVYYPHLYVVKEDGEPPLRMWALSCLIQDRADVLPSYQQFVQQLKDKVMGQGY